MFDLTPRPYDIDSYLKPGFPPAFLVAESINKRRIPEISGNVQKSRIIPSNGEILCTTEGALRDVEVESPRFWPHILQLRVN